MGIRLCKLIKKQHEWFKASNSSKDSEYRDFYFWRKPKYDADGKRHPPNNWSAVWGGVYLSVAVFTFFTKESYRKRLGV